MSEQQTTASTVLSRPRRPMSRLRDLPIWSKLGVIMLVPTLATIVVGTNGLIGHIDTASGAERARVLAELTGFSGELVHHLQHERANAVMLLGAEDDAQAEDRTVAYGEAQQKVDEAQQEYETERSGLTDLPSSFRALLSDIAGRLSGLPQLRNQVVAGELELTGAVASYEELIRNLVGIRDSSAQLARDSTLGDQMRAVAGISRAKEFLSQQRVIGHEALIRGRYDQQLQSGFIGAQHGYESSLASFNGVGSAAEQTMLEQTLEGSDVRQSGLYQDYLDSLESGAPVQPEWDAADWDAVMLAHADLLREMEDELDGEVVTQATTLREAVTQQVLVQTGALLVMLALAILLAWLVARSMARSLRDLRQGALAVAQYGLPQAVARLRDPALSTQLSPGQVATQIAEPLPVRSKDEFGQVTEAFNAVHLEAVRTAAEQAALRSSVATMFVNLARRSQILVDRLIGHLDRLERGEEDPDRLAELFQLDHLATRMRRNDENLLVLAGADSTRVQRQPAALIDVLRAAQSEVEHYTRIELGVIDRDIEVAAHAVNDLVHLVAELFDNATAFSPPESHVLVEARRVGDRAVLYVEDRGLGMSAEQLADINERLATPPLVDVAVSRMMGLVVVSRLAARHGVKVELRPAADRGTIADVTLPTAVLVPRGLAGAEPAAPQPQGRDGATAMPRSPLSAPLALESGPSTSLPPLPPLALPPRDEQPSTRPADYPRPAPGGGRPMPVWSDLTGATGTNGADLTPPPAGGTPLPRRRPGEPRRADGGDPATEWPPIAEQSPADAPPDGARSGAPPSERSLADTPSDSAVPRAAAPPVWPPVAPGPTPAASEGAQPAAAPVEPAAGQTHDSRTQPPAGAEPYTPPQAAPAASGEKTMELPIFRELESAWFRTRRPAQEQRVPPPAARDDAQAAGEAAEYATVGASGATAALGADGGSVAPGAGETAADDSWRTAADDGWRAASGVAEVMVSETTEAGLPKRRPMEQLVPGGVDKGPATPQRRTPEAVRGLLSAYHRGVQRGRDQTTDDMPQSTHAGKEHEE